MEKIEWLDQYNTGIAEIDTQHQQIVEYLNQLRESRMSGNIQGAGDVLDGMVDYTLSHFAFEESLMEQVNYPYASAHKSVHDTFIKRVAQFQVRFREGENVTEELHALLKRWLINHIQRDDAAYVRPVKVSMDALVADAPAKAQGAAGTSWISRAVRKFFG